MVLVPRHHDDFGLGNQAKNILNDGKPLFRAIGIGG